MKSAKIWGALVHFSNLQLPLRWQLDPDWVKAASQHFELNEVELEREIERLEKDALMWARIAKFEPTSKSYQVASEALKLALNKYGYRSLAQFERAY